MQVIAERFFVDEDHHPYEGELAQVLRTYDRKNQMRPVAIKLFREGSLDTRVVLEAFARECESLAKVSGHVNIVPLVDHGTDPESGRKYIALEWAESNLLELVRRQPVSDWDAFYERFGASILDALAFAFANDVMHRDVKPQNVLIDAAGTPLSPAPRGSSRWTTARERTAAR
ncbi:MAG TPA: protein kinase [Sphingomicrobium sp.]